MNGKWVIHLGIAALAGFGLHAFAGDFAAATETVGPNAKGFETPVNQLVTPAGTLIQLPGMRPNALALSPDGKRLVTAGLTQRLVVIDPATGKILQGVRMPADNLFPTSEPVARGVLQPDEKAKLSFTGLVFSPDGSRIYLANVNGDIKVFGVDQDHNVTPLYSIPLPPANAPLRQAEIPAGIAVSPDGKRLYVAGNLSNHLIELEAATGKVLQLWDVGVAPFDVVLAGRKIYVSNWGGRRPDADSATGPAGDGMRVRVDARSIANEGSVSVIDLVETGGASVPASSDENGSSVASPHPSKEILTGLHACALALSPDGRWLVVANAGSDTLSVIDTRTDKIAETICAR
jgi:YVTN family beta-propeller protein